LKLLVCEQSFVKYQLEKPEERKIQKSKKPAKQNENSLMKLNAIQSCRQRSELKLSYTVTHLMSNPSG